MKKNMIAFLLLLSLAFSLMPQIAVIANDETVKTIESVFSNVEMNMRSDLSGKFTNNENGAYKSGGINGSFIDGTITIETPGVYHFYADMLLKAKGGIVQFSVNGKDIGNRCNTSSGNDINKEVDFGSVYIADSGKISIRLTSKDTNGMGYDLGLKSVKIVKESVQIKAITDKVGNVFTEGDEVKFVVSMKNLTKNKFEISADTEAISSYGTTVDSDIINLEISSSGTVTKIITIPITEKNTYTLRITVNIPAEKEKIVYEIPFSYVEKIAQDSTDSIFGTCLHISDIKKDTEQMNNMMTMLKQSGIKWVRDEYYWDHVEKQKGKYTFYADDYINSLIDTGIKPLIILSYSNGLYGGNPHEEAGYTAFANYAKALAEHFNGKIEAFEVWNEWNGGWGQGYGADVYAGMLKEVYKAVKSVNPDIKVVAGATITAADSWFDELFQSGAFDYCDAISYHPYCMPDTPDEKTYRGNVEDNAENMYKVMEKYGNQKEQWITEWGWYTGNGGAWVTEDAQADYLTRGYISGAAYGLDKIFMYDFKNDGVDINYSEHNFGIINSWEESENVKYAAKQSYVATAAASNKINGAKFSEEFRPDTNSRIYKFERGDEEIIAMYYTAENYSDTKSSKIEIVGETAKMSAYDIFGNSLTAVNELNSSPVYIVGKKGTFNVEDIVLKERESALITFGKFKNSDGIYVDEHHDMDNKNDINCFTIGSENRFNSIDCKVDDSYIYGGTNSIAIEIAYLDSGTGGFYIQYNAAGEENNKKTDLIKLTNTNKWKKAKIYIDDAKFANGLDNSDFKVILNDEGKDNISFSGIRIVKTADEKPRIMSVSFDNDEEFADMETTKSTYYYPIGGDGINSYLSSELKGFSYTEKNEKKCVFASAQGEALYIYCDVLDSLLYGTFDPVKISVDYFDEGYGTFTLTYDNGNYTQFKESDIITLGDTKQWKTAEFILNDCWWKNCCNSLSDFRIALWGKTMGRSPEGVAFSKISVEVLDGVKAK